MKSVAIYCRLSEEDRFKLNKGDDSESIQNQKNMLIQYAVEQGWSIYEIYSDDDWAGTDRSRPAWNKLLRDAEKQKFDIILCKSQARFTRELEMVEKYIHNKFLLWGIRFISLADNADTDNPGNKKSRQINGLVNEWYLEDLSNNIKSVFDDKRKRGVHIGAFALYGYKKDPDVKGHLIIDEEAAEIVREVFRLFIAGNGKSHIAKILNERGIPNPTEYKRLKGLRNSSSSKKKNSTLWRYYTISSMLVNQMYIGNMVQGRYGTVSYKTHKNVPRPRDQWYIVEGTHDAIIDMETWNMAQNLIKEKSRPMITGEIGAFTGKVICKSCGYACRTCKSHGKHYFKCGTRAIKKDVCPGSFIPVTELESIVLKELNGIAKEYLDKDTIETGLKLDDDLDKRISSMNKSLNEKLNKFRQYDDVIKNLYIDKVKGVISDSEFISMKESFEKDKSELKNQIQIMTEHIQELESRKSNRQNRVDIVEHYMQLDHLNREAVQILIDKIYISKRDPVTKQIPIEIYWNF